MTSRVTALYIRVSSARQERDGMSLEAQESRLRGRAASEAWEPFEVVIEARSAKDVSHRPAWTAVLARMRAGEVGRIVACKLDRMTRSVRDACSLIEECEAHDCALVSLNESLDTSSAMGRFFVRMLAALAELEREVISERVGASLAHLRDTGRVYSSSPPYGWRAVDGKLVEDATEQARLGDMLSLRANGHSYDFIARTLVTCRVPARTGTWTATTVRRIILREQARRA